MYLKRRSPYKQTHTRAVHTDVSRSNSWFRARRAFDLASKRFILRPLEQNDWKSGASRTAQVICLLRIHTYIPSGKFSLPIVDITCDNPDAASVASQWTKLLMLIKTNVKYNW